MKVAVLTKIPSPYQVELFNAIAEHGEIDLVALYLRESDSNRQWKPKTIRHSSVFLNCDSGRATRELQDCDLAVFAWYQNGIWKLIRTRAGSGKPWCFWGERPGFRGAGILGAAYRRLLLQPLRRDQRVPIWGIGTWAVDGYRKEFGTNRPYVSVPYVSNLQPFFDRATSGRDGPLKILFSGSLIRRKGARELCRVFTSSLFHRTDIRLVIMGSGPLEGELRLITRNDSRVTYLGFRDWDEISEAYGSADLLCAPSHYDGWGLIVPEALAAGVPVVASTHMGSSREIIVDGETGWLVPPRDEDALRVAIEKALDRGRDGLRKMGQSGRIIAENYTVDAGAMRFVSASRSALDAWHSTTNR